MPAARSSKKPNPGCGMVTGGKFKHVNVMGTNPLREQFAPTEGQPIRQRARMAGDPMGESNASNSAARKAAGEEKGVFVTLPAGMTDRQLEKAAGASDPSSKVGQERLRRINDPVR